LELRNKVILIVAQEDWGNMFLSKHHYAYELSKRGNQVFFLNGPEQRNRLRPGEIKITASGTPGISLVEHRFFYPYLIKFHAKWLHEILVRWHIHRILKSIGTRVDIVWSFDISDTMPLRQFPAGIPRIFMPVDEPLNEAAITSARGADYIFSVTTEILDKYRSFNIPGRCLNHGVADVFLSAEPKQKSKDSDVHVGMSGNMLRQDIDHDTVLKIMQLHPEVTFHIWGTISAENSNLIASHMVETASAAFIRQLHSMSNVRLHGPLHFTQLAREIKSMDAFLICYDPLKDQSKGTNYHKILEYLATGKVVVANNVTAYKDQPGLVQMSKSRKNNLDLPELFHQVITNLHQFNSAELQDSRRSFAAAHTYSQQVTNIESFLCNSGIINKVVNPSEVAVHHHA
jgi:glycosyltransferase involved in cell wall biosynthesis